MIKKTFIYFLNDGRKALLSSLFLMCIPVVLLAQGQKLVQGTVSDANGEPLIGVNVLEKGTANGSITDIDGKYSLRVESRNATLVFSFIGYVKQEVSVGNNSVINISLAEDTRVISEVVVTALGIRREEKALGYSVQKVDGEKLSIAKGSSVATSLTGKIAGLNVKNSTEFTREPSLTLRGASPLIVIDGVPYQSASLTNIAAEDIESINVLKGSTASALYGARGGNGAIMVTTKKARKEGLDISIDSHTMLHAGFLKLPEVQNSYSSGANGKYAPGDYVWGDKLDMGRTAKQYDPVTYEWREQELTSKGKDNFTNFLEQAFVTNNNISIAQKGQYGGIRTSLNHVYNKGQYPNNNQQKFTFSVGGNIDYKNFHLDGGITYNKRFFSNNTGTGYGVGSFMYNLLIWTGAEYDLRDYRNYWRAGKEQQQQNWMDELWYDNPYFLAYAQTFSNHYDLTNSYLNMSYDLAEWLKLQVRLGSDAYRDRDEQKRPISSRSNLKGQYETRTRSGYSTNNDALIIADKRLGDFNIDGFLGGSIFFREGDEHYSSTSNGLNMPGFFSLNASVDPAVTNSSVSKQQTNSIYGKAGISWRSAVFAEVTGRNDWVSTLAASERSYFYPSVSGSVILSEFIPLPKVFNFWKVRGSWTQTKYPAGVYDINSTYSVSRNYWGDMTATFYPKSIRDITLKPSASTSYEIGTAFHFFANRLKFDLAYYNKLDYDLQTQARMSYASGFETTLINYGEQQLSRGFEFSVSGDIFKSKDFDWNSTLNFAADRYYYHKIDEEYSTKKPWIKEGADRSWIEMLQWEKDPNGNLILYNGMPKLSNYPVLAGSSNPSWIWGWMNSFHYRNVRLAFSFDGRVGGYMFNNLESRLWHSGRNVDSDNQWRYDEVVNGKRNYVAEGVKIVSGSVKYDSDGNITEDTRVFAPNDVQVSYESFIRTYMRTINTSNFLQDKTFLKLRELSIGYTIPQSICKSLKIANADVALIGQNLFIWTKAFRYTDPDLDDGNVSSPSIRYIGFNIKLNF